MNKDTFLKSDSIIVFACGAKPNVTNPGGRDRVIEYAEKNLTQFQFLMAERFFSFFQNHDRIDLLSLENKLAEFSDCILIILESESTFAELGAFTNSDELAKIALVINDIKHDKSDSFINLGPLAKINKISNFRPVIQANMESILTVIYEVQKRLEKIERKNNIRLDISTYEKFLACSRKARTFLLLDLLALFSPLRYSELIEILHFIYGDHSIDINLEMGLLAAFGFVSKQDDYYFRTLGDSKLFFFFQGLNIIRFRSDIINCYFKLRKSRERLEILKGRTIH
ncbi:MAG: retron St85 family effector protein [Ignavibacteriales bacterium]|nr:retron St85 family effector protein [Ignavibacteriales bacterium]